MLKRPATWLIFFTSLTVRLAAWLWVTANDTPAFMDENGYLAQAWACKAFLNAIFHGALPSAAIRDAVYACGVWPPLHGFLLSLGFMCGELGGVRLVPVLLSACTTLFILKLALQCGLSFRKAALAALFHALYPESIAFSHYLWSETTFSFFLLPGLVFAFASSDAVQSGKRGLAHIAAAGALLGCAGLCRATVLPVLFLLSAWWMAPALKTFWSARDKRFMYPILQRIGLLFGIFFLAAGPWLLTLRLREGEWKPFSTSGGYNFYLGNHPAIPRGLGSAWGTNIYIGGALLQITERIMGQSGPLESDLGNPLWVFAQDKACRAAAWEEIYARPQAAVKRAFLRAGTLFAPDIFLPRHILELVYRPMPVASAAIIILLGVAAWVTVLLGVSLALCRVRLAPRLWLLVLLAGLLASPALATISMSRMRFASTLLLLPVVCEGLAALRRPGSSIPGPLRKACAACLLLASLTLCFVFLRPAFKHFVVPSGHYGALISACSHIGLMPPDTVNTLLFRRGPSGPQTIGLDMASAPSVSVVGQPNNRKVLIELPQPNQFRSVIVHAKAGEPLLLKWFVPGRDLAATTEFAPGAFSCEWRPTGLPDVSVKTGINYKKDIWSGQ